MKTIFTTALIALCTFAARAKDHSETVTQDAKTSALTGQHTPLSFIENKGQITDQNHNARPDIQFRIAAAPGLNIFIGNGEIHYQFSMCGSTANSKSQIPNAKAKFSKSKLPAFAEKTMTGEANTYTMCRMDVELVGANKNAQLVAEEKQSYYENHFTANTGDSGARAYTYNRITYKDIYPNIDWVLYMKNGLLEHEFVINAGGNVSDIQIKYGGATSLQLNAGGGLTAATPQGTITEQPPTSYQTNGKAVKSSFKLTGNLLTYVTDSYSGILVIDPALEWATYYGGGSVTRGQCTEADGSGNVYVTGFTFSTSNVVTSGAYQTLYGGNEDAFLAKFNSLGNLLWSTYYGGSGEDEADGLAIDRSGSVYITGTTTSASGIATPGSYDVGYDSLWGNGFLAKFSGAGILEWATYYANCAGVAVDGSGNVFITGYTRSDSGIATPGAYQTVFGGEGDAFLAKFNAGGSLLWATYYGGSGADEATGIAIDSLDNVYILGATESLSGIATPGAYQSVFGGEEDAFLAKFNNGGDMLWATYYYGGDSTDAFGEGITTDDASNVFITVSTNSTTGFATPGAYQDTAEGLADAFLAKFNSTGNLLWATYYGGSGYDNGVGVATDGSGNVYMTGATQSSSGIATLGSYQPVYGGGEDAFLAKFNSGGALLWATYYGGSNQDEGYGVAIDSTGVAYVTGQTGSASGIATPGSYQDTLYGTGVVDAFLAKFSDAGTTAVRNLELPTQDINLYPNPVQNMLTVTSPTVITGIDISNLLGQEVQTLKCNTLLAQMDVSDLPAGVYLIKINGAVVKKFVKE